MAVQTVESRKGMLFAEASRCLLCDDPTCSRACTAGIDCGRILRAVNFKNVKGARRRLTNPAACQNCPAPCESACRRSALDRPVSIRQTLTELAKEPLVPAEPADEQLLETQQLGVKFKNPFLLSSSVVGSNYEMVARAFEMGWGGVCFKTIGTFVPEEVSPRFGALAKEDSPMIGFKNAEQISDHTLDENLSFLRRLKADYPDRVIIASIMGRDEEEWTLLAKLMEENGADIIELNFSCPQMVGEGMGSDVGTNPELVKAYTAAAKRGTSLPVLAKMTPNITDMTVPAEAAMLAGSDGLAAINTVKSVMNVDLYSFVSEPRIAGSSCVSGYSGKAVKPIALRFISDMASDAALKDVPISGMGGIENWIDAAEFMALGCGSIQVTTAVMQYGYRIIEDMKEGMIDYLKETGAGSVSQIVGKGLPALCSADDLDRSSIEYPLFVRSRCIGCGRCYVSCADGGHQAISMTGPEGKPVMDPRKCVGCQLCMLVCPAAAIEPGRRVPKTSIKRV